MGLIEEEGLTFAIFYYIHKVLTWGWIAEILIVILSLVSLIYLAIIIKEWRTIIFIIKDKYLFLKHFLYLYLIEKYNFLMSYWVMVKFNFSQWNTYFIIIMTAGILLVGFLIFFGFNIFMEMGQQKATTLS